MLTVQMINHDLPLHFPITCAINEGPYGPPPTTTYTASLFLSKFNYPNTVDTPILPFTATPFVTYLWVIYDDANG